MRPARSPPAAARTSAPHINRSSAARCVPKQSILRVEFANRPMNRNKMINMYQRGTFFVTGLFRFAFVLSSVCCVFVLSSLLFVFALLRVHHQQDCADAVGRWERGCRDWVGDWAGSGPADWEGDVLAAKRKARLLAFSDACTEQVQKTQPLFRAICVPEVIILPRQARDKHRESSTQNNEGVFEQTSSSYTDVTCLEQRNECDEEDEVRDNAGSFFEFPLCLSRACLGKMFVFIHKWQIVSAVRRPFMYVYKTPYHLPRQTRDKHTNAHTERERKLTQKDAVFSQCEAYVTKRMTDHYRDCIETLPDGTTRDNCADESHAIVYGKKTNAGERGAHLLDSFISNSCI
jgi:hypothetical protein